jgi:GNAT superfamily N-acetyltransferase
MSPKTAEGLARQTAPLIRRARKSDLTALHHLNVELQDYERKVRPSRRPGQSLRRSYITRLLGIQRRGAGRVLVAVIDERIVAFAACALEKDPLESNPLIVVITDLVVAAPYRSHRIGSALLQSARAFARERNARRLHVSALRRNFSAQRFYRSRGFHEYAVTFEQRIAAQPPKSR